MEGEAYSVLSRTDLNARIPAGREPAGFAPAGSNDCVQGVVVVVVGGVVVVLVVLVVVVVSTGHG